MIAIENDVPDSSFFFLLKRWVASYSNGFGIFVMSSRRFNGSII